jgi:hypothetical protein
MTLILRKLLASSTYAISGTLNGLALKLEIAAKQAEAVDSPPDGLAENLEEFDEIADEWELDEREESGDAQPQFSPQQVAEMRGEMAKLREFHALAKSIARNSKGEVLLTALRRGFAAAAEAQQGTDGATFQQKALIFTESRRTQEYLFGILEQTEFAGKVMLFNGTNNDARSKEIYRRWLDKNKDTDRVSGSPGADMRAAHNGYFAADKPKKGQQQPVWRDTRGDTQADDEVYNLIMKDKERLLSEEEPLRFIFSHSALREGWDNPNVFQICTLNETRSAMKKRQEIGRGLRLPVNQHGQRVFDESVNCFGSA